jgi:glycosyltransferase involved in cell wall biosynthesis
MRIVHVVVTDAFAGVESHVARLASGQAIVGDDVTVVGGDSAQIRVASDSRVELLPGHTVAQAVRSLGLLRPEPDVVHAHMTAAELASAMYRPVARNRVPLVVTRHFASHRGRGIRRLVVAPYISRRVASQIAIGNFTASRIEGSSVVIPAGIAPPDSGAAVMRRPFVLMAQRLEREKRADLGVQAFARSGLGDRNWTLRIAGDGSERAAVEALVSDLGIAGSTMFLGFRSDVPRLLAESSIFLAPTPGEHFGLSVLEAMAHGLPVVADASGGHLESLGDVGEPGLYATADYRAAAETLSRLAADPIGRQTYGQTLQRRQLDHFSLDNQVRLTSDVYRAAIRQLSGMPA